MASKSRSLLSVILPKKRGNGKGVSYTNTFDPNAQGGTVTAPDYRDHLTDIFTTRASDNSGDLLRNLFKTDPDVSAALSAYLTVADTEPVVVVRDALGVPSQDGHEVFQQLLMKLNTRFDYTKGFDSRRTLRATIENFRHMLLLRGSIGAEAIVDVDMSLLAIRNVDMRTIKWYEKTPGVYVPAQEPTNDSNNEINLDIPTFFTANFRTDPTNIYTDSPWVSVINTVAARQQIVNDLYRIMQITGYPRIVVRVLEQVLNDNMPADIRMDEARRREWANARFNEIRTALSNPTANQSIITWDSYEFDMLNEKAPGMEMDISPMMDMLNAQNQAALKVMATVIGRGTQGVNTSTVESRIFAMNADQLNRPIADLLSQIFTFGIRMMGFDGYVEYSFRPAELRPDLELEPQRVMKQTRLLQNLSLGKITDVEYSMEMFGRPPHPDEPELSGTNFMPLDNAPSAEGGDGANSSTTSTTSQSGQRQSATGRQAVAPKKSSVDNPRKA